MLLFNPIDNFSHIRVKTKEFKSLWLVKKLLAFETNVFNIKYESKQIKQNRK